MARTVAPGSPHHVTQRGNRRQQTFFNEEDYQSYLELMTEWCEARQVDIWACCLMPNHIHLILPQRVRFYIILLGELLKGKSVSPFVHWAFLRTRARMA